MVWTQPLSSIICFYWPSSFGTFINKNNHLRVLFCRSHYNYFPFSLGPRNCIGQNFAQVHVYSLNGIFFNRANRETGYQRINTYIICAFDTRLRPRFCCHAFFRRSSFRWCLDSHAMFLKEWLFDPKTVSCVPWPWSGIKKTSPYIFTCPPLLSFSTETSSKLSVRRENKWKFNPFSSEKNTIKAQAMINLLHYKES